MQISMNSFAGGLESGVAAGSSMPRSRGPTSSVDGEGSSRPGTIARLRRRLGGGPWSSEEPAGGPAATPAVDTGRQTMCRWEERLRGLNAASQLGHPWERWPGSRQRKQRVGWRHAAARCEGEKQLKHFPRRSSGISRRGRWRRRGRPH
jgi:hypothetical protein